MFNAVVAMSQGAQVYHGSTAPSQDPSELEALTGEEWMLLFRAGKVLSWWTVPANWNSLLEFHRVGTDAELDRIVFIFDPNGTTDLDDDLARVGSIVAVRYPAAEFIPALLVGSEGHGICKWLGRPVKAAATHAAFIGQLPCPDLDVPCSGFDDAKGHLTDVGATLAQEQLATYFIEG